MNLKIILRGILKEKVNFLLTLIGLSVGFGAFLILQFLIDIETNYDTFHSDYDNIYRVITKEQSNDGAQRIALSDGLLKEHLKGSFGSINGITQFIPIYYGILVHHKDEFFEEQKGLYVDESFNEVFDFTVIEGNVKSMFSDINSIALNRTLALKYFGKVSAVGQALLIDDGFGIREFIVTGVYDDVPENSSVQFDYLISGLSYPNWGKLKNRGNKNYFFTYLKFDKKVSAEDIFFIESDINQRNLSLNNSEHISARKYMLQPIKDIHLDTLIEYDLSDKTEAKQIYILWFISLSIILITSINFINTNTILSSSKIKLLGMAKLFGYKNPFSKILILDSLIKIILALIVSLVAIGILNEWVFEQLFHFKLFITSVKPLIIGGVVFIVIGLIGGLIPANYLGKKRISDIIKGKILIARGKYSNLKLISLALQLTIVIVLLITTTIVIKQLYYFDSKDVGYSKANKVLIPAPRGVDHNSYLQFINETKSLHYINGVGVSFSQFYSKYRSLDILISENDKKEYKVLHNLVNSHYIPSMGIEIKEGHNFTGVSSSDTIGVIINETASKEFFNNKNVLNSSITADVVLFSNNKFKVIGVMKDFNFESFGNTIEPLLYFCLPFDDFVGDITINYETGALAKLESDLPEVWKRSGIETPLEFELLENAYSETYKPQMLFNHVSKTFTMLTLLLSLFGLFAYLRQNIEFKTKELVIRRILGATGSQIYYYLNREIFILFMICAVISMPIGIFIANKWLSQFVYRTVIGWDSFIIPISITLIIIVILGLYEAFAVLSKKIVEVLKNE